ESQRREAGYRLADQKYGIRADALQRRGVLHGQLLGEAFGRQQTAYGEQLGLSSRQSLGEYVSPVQEARAKAEELRERTLATDYDARRLNNLRLQRMANLQRGREIGQEIHTARAKLESMQGAAGSEAGREIVAQELDAANERRKQNAQELLKIDEEDRRVRLEGSQRDLQLREQGLATAKQTADTLRNRKQSFRETLGGMLPEQQLSLATAVKDLAAGNANRLQREMVERYAPDIFSKEIREDKERHIIPEALQQIEGAAGNFNRELGAAEGREQREMKLTVDQRQQIAAELHFDVSHASKEIADLFVPLLQRAHDDLLKQIDKKIEDANHDLNRRQNEQGRSMAGG
ncbi:MAG: hypothetical protein KGL35_10070, partial [Bradyrhizobium sp.]|nr:hypothetical protein [Bradyrhizobium sp.]